MLDDALGWLFGPVPLLEKSFPWVVPIPARNVTWLWTTLVIWNNVYPNTWAQIIITPSVICSEWWSFKSIVDWTSSTDRPVQVVSSDLPKNAMIQKSVWQSSSGVQILACILPPRLQQNGTCWNSKELILVNETFYTSVRIIHCTTELMRWFALKVTWFASVMHKVQVYVNLNFYSVVQPCVFL